VQNTGGIICTGQLETYSITIPQTLPNQASGLLIFILLKPLSYKMLNGIDLSIKGDICWEGNVRTLFEEGSVECDACSFNVNCCCQERLETENGNSRLKAYRQFYAGSSVEAGEIAQEEAFMVE
jgi:hypothetical protein